VCVRVCVCVCVCVWGGWVMPSVKHWYTGVFFLGRTSTYLLFLVILVGVRGIELASQSLSRQSSFYHWAKSPRYPYISHLLNCIYILSCTVLQDAKAAHLECKACSNLRDPGACKHTVACNHGVGTNHQPTFNQIASSFINKTTLVGYQNNLMMYRK